MPHSFILPAVQRIDRYPKYASTRLGVRLRRLGRVSGTLPSPDRLARMRLAAFGAAGAPRRYKNLRVSGTPLLPLPKSHITPNVLSPVSELPRRQCPCRSFSLVCVLWTSRPEPLGPKAKVLPTVVAHGRLELGGDSPGGYYGGRASPAIYFKIDVSCHQSGVFATRGFTGEEGDRVCGDTGADQ